GARPEVKEATAPQAPGEAKAEEKGPSPEDKSAEERAKEEKEYQKRVREVTERLKSARDRYLMATRGTSGPEPTVPTTQEEMRTRADDLISRLRDVQQGQAGVTYEPGLDLPKPATGAPPTTVQTGPIQARPQAGPAPPGYTERQKQLSDLRNGIYQLEQERDRLIQEMKQKGFETGSLFLD
ncbi:MAG: hypothetical protein HYV04_09670, partial [Deltaproteobacteria bacterium]|nr:hypothetical protein [Deltaproteobacteria bacterium]